MFMRFSSLQWTIFALLVLVLTLNDSAAMAPPGSVDLGFHAEVNGEVWTTAVQPDGKIVIAGAFTQVDGVAMNGVARLDAQGRLDATFDVGVGLDGRVRCVAIQEDGKILVGGEFSSVSGEPRPLLARLLPNGSLDAGFVPPVLTGRVNALLVQLDGRVVVAGGEIYGLRRLLESGAEDGSFRFREAGVSATFQGEILTLGVQGEGAIIVGGDFSYSCTMEQAGENVVVTRNRLARFTSDGVLDPAFVAAIGAPGSTAPPGQVGGNRVSSEGEVTPIEPNYIPEILAVHTDGTIEAGGLAKVKFAREGPVDHGAAGVWRYTAGDARDVLSLQANGHVLYSSTFDLFGGTMVRSNADSTSTTGYAGFGNAKGGPISNGYLLASGKTLIAGGFTGLGGVPFRHLALLHNDAPIDLLTRPRAEMVRWRRDASAPAVQYVKFDVSTNGGVTWTDLGAGLRISAGSSWECVGISLPLSGILRARGRVAGGWRNGSSGLVETRLVYDETLPELEVASQLAQDVELVSVADHVDFGSTLVGVPVTRHFTLRNSGQGELGGLSASLLANSSGTFVVASNPAGAVAGGEATRLTVTYNPSDTGSHGAVLRITSEDADEPEVLLSLTGASVSPLRAWRERHFGLIIEAGKERDVDDYEGDGVLNLMEYAFGLDPKTNSAGLLPQPVLEGDDLVIRFTPPLGVTDVIYGAEASAALVAGSWVPVTNSGAGREHVYRLRVSSETGALKFMRVLVKTP